MSKEMDLLKRILATGWLDHELSCEVEKLLAQPEQEPTTRHALNNYWKKFALDSYWNQEAYQRGYAQAELDLKREPLTPQQISEGNQSMFNVTREAFKQGVKFAEDMHGIGGGECVAT